MTLKNFSISILFFMAVANSFLASANVPPAAQSAEPERRFAVTTLSVNYLREAPDFTAELGNQLLMGTPVEIIGKNGYWTQVLSPEPYKAWCVDLGLAEMTESELEEYISAPKLICVTGYSNVLTQPKKKSQMLSDFVLGDIVMDGEQSRGKYKKIVLASGQIGYVPKKDVRPLREWAESREATAENLLATAREFLGVPYFWGGTSVKGVDCSGLTRMVWFMNGVLLPRNASQQARVGVEVELLGEGFGASGGVSGGASAEGTEDVRENAAANRMRLKISKLQAGDLIFFGTPAEYDGAGNEIRRERVTHVGIYIGDGRFIHASKYVRINSLIPGEEDWYELSDRLIRARRVIGCGEDDGVIPILRSGAYFPQE